MVAIGVAIGLAASAGVTRLMQSQFFGVSALDPITHLAVRAVAQLAWYSLQAARYAPRAAHPVASTSPLLACPRDRSALGPPRPLHGATLGA